MTIINSYNNNRLFSIISFSVQEAYNVVLRFHVSRLLYSIFFYFIQGFYFVCTCCHIHLNKSFRVEETETPATLAFPWLKQSVREWQILDIVHFHQFSFYAWCVSLPFPMFIWSVWTRHIGNHLPSILFSLHCTNSKVVYLWGLYSIIKKKCLAVIACGVAVPAAEKSWEK